MESPTFKDYQDRIPEEHYQKHDGRRVLPADKQPLLAVEDSDLPLFHAAVKPQPHPALDEHPEPRPSAPPIYPHGPQYLHQHQQPWYNGEHPQPYPFQNMFDMQEREPGSIPVTTQPRVAVNRQDNTSFWVGSNGLIIVTAVIMVICGHLPGVVAILLAVQARKKKQAGEYGDAKRFSYATIGCNIFIVVFNVTAIAIACIIFARNFKQLFPDEDFEN